MKQKRMASVLVAIGLSVIACSSLLCGNAIELYEDEMPNIDEELQLQSELNMGFPMRAPCTNIALPTVSTPYRHNCLTTYTIKQNDVHATNVELYRGGSDRYPIDTYDMPQGSTRNILGICSTSIVCAPSVFVVRAKCPDCGNSVGISMGNVVEYPIYEVTYTMSSGVIPTTFDKEGNVWTHGSLKEDYIHFSIAYQGSVKDGRIYVPPLGTRTAGPYTLNGVEFSIRTGPNRISIKASQPISCNDYDTVFAFSSNPESIIIQSV